MPGRRLHLARRTLAALATCAAVVLATAGTARAAGAASGASAPERWPATGAAVAKAMTIADAEWGTVPCGGQVTIVWHRLTPALNARSTWAYQGDDLYGAPATNTDCEIELSAAMPDWDWVKLCSVIVHEVGHLTGHRHSSDRASIMYPEYVRADATCARTPEPARGSANSERAEQDAASRTAARTAPRHVSHRRVHRRAQKRR